MSCSPGRSFAAHCFAVLAAGCAGTPPAEAPAYAGEGRQALAITTMEWIERPTPGAGFGKQVSESKPVNGAACIARNEKGASETTTPGVIAPFTGAGTLTIECTLPGYRTAKVGIDCVTPRARSTREGAMAGLQLFSAVGPAAVFAAPAAVVGALAGSVTVGAAAGNALAGPDPDTCNYAGRETLTIWVTRE